MNRLAGSIAYGFFNMLHPRMLWLMFWPLLVAVFAWGVAAFLFWARAALWIAAQLKQWIESGILFFRFDTGDAMLVAAHILLLVLFVPLVYLTALFILSLFGMQAMVDHVAERRFPALARRRGGSAAGNAWNGVVALAGMAGLAILTLPFWVIPPLWPLIPVVVMAWVNQRVLRYDALAEHATPEEMRAIFAERRRSLYMLGLVLAVLAYVPVLGFFAPVMIGLAFIHYLLSEVQARRIAPIEGEVLRPAIDA